MTSAEAARDLVTNEKAPIQIEGLFVSVAPHT
jgi:hypothetical protein